MFFVLVVPHIAFCQKREYYYGPLTAMEVPRYCYYASVNLSMKLTPHSTGIIIPVMKYCQNHEESILQTPPVEINMYLSLNIPPEKGMKRLQFLPRCIHHSDS